VATFAAVIETLLAAEGGYVNHAADAGGATKFGISSRQYPNVNIKSLSLSKACEIYEKDFWNFYSLNSVHSQPLANQLFMTLINMSPLGAVRCFQKAVNTCGSGVTVSVDGLLGYKTINAINAAPRAWLMDLIRLEVARYYLAVVSENRSQDVFLLGWMRRALA